MEKQEELVQVQQALNKLKVMKSFVIRMQKLDALVAKQAILVAMRELRQMGADAEKSFHVEK